MSRRYRAKCETEGLNPWRVIENLGGCKRIGVVEVQPYRRDPETSLRRSGRTTLCFSYGKYHREPFQITSGGYIMFWPEEKEEAKEILGVLKRVLRELNRGDFRITSFEVEPLQTPTKRRAIEIEKVLRVSRDHSMSLLPGLYAADAEIKNPKVDEYVEERYEEKIPQDRLLVRKRMFEEHLSGGYPDVWRLLQEWRKKKSECKKETKKLIGEVSQRLQAIMPGVDVWEYAAKLLLWLYEGRDIGGDLHGRGRQAVHLP